VPPALSPLDAFAMQGRLLQKRFEEQKTAGHRLSRLPPTTIASEFAKPRPDFFRSMTSSSLGTQSAPGGTIDDEGPFGNTLEIRSSGPRPKSHYPQMIDVENPHSTLPRTNPYEAQLLEFVREAAAHKAQAAQDTNYWTMQRSASPEDFDATPLAEPVSNGYSRSPPLPFARLADLSSSTPSNFSTTQSLIVPSLTSSHQSPASTRRQYTPNLNELSHLSIASSSSSISIDKLSPPPHEQNFIFPRSPSLKSIQSMASNPPRPSFNFSRPISRQSRPSIDSKRVPFTETPHRQFSGSRVNPQTLDVAYRQDSMEAPLPPFTTDTPQTPTSMASEELNNSSEPRVDSTPASFVYKKYTLVPPKEEVRRVSARVSVGFEEFISSQFNWDGPSAESNLDLQLSAPFILPQSPPSPVQTSSPPSNRRRNKPTELLLGSVGGSPRTSGERTRRKLQKLRPGTSGTDGSGYRAAPPPGSPLTMDKVAQEHLDRGVELYQTGNLEESIYHWRLAATAGQPTAMLLYALACRHGWGIKPTLSESQMWLTSAVNHPQMQLSDDEDTSRNIQQQNSTGRKDLKAQFAINVYELGMTYSNGWGVAKDASLALRCFEIAGSWGDGDAHAEAARCWLEGIGCRKDVQKAAKLYRLAELKGVAVPGNSW